MKLAISNIAWDVTEQGAVVELLDKYHFSGLEVAPSKIWERPAEATDDEVRVYRQAMSRRGLAIVGIQSALYGHPELMLFGAKQTRSAMLNYLMHMIRVCTKLGGGILVFGNPKNRRIDGLSMEEADDIAVAFFRQLGDIAQRSGVIIGLEPNAADYGTNFMVNVDQTLQVVEKVGHPSVGLNMDLGVLQLNSEDISNAIRKVAVQICHFHISEPFLRPLIPSSVHSQAADALREVGYDGWVSIEMLTSPEGRLDEIERALTIVAKEYQ